MLAVDFFYLRQFPDSHLIAQAFLPAAALELGFYLASVLEQTRNSLKSLRPARAQALILWISAVLPYLIFSLIAGTFQINAFYLLVGLSAILSFWFTILPRRPAYDLGFLIIAAAPLVARVFSRIYLSPDRHFRADILGHLMWIRLGIVALLVLRDWDPGAFGLWPSLAEWRKGALYYCLALIPVAGLALALHAVRWAPLTGPWWKIAGLALATFFGFLWVTAISEELFFRGVIARALLSHLPSRLFAIVLSAAIFGAAHLWFRQFPDWRQSAVSTMLGIFCVLAYARTGSVKTSMVAHTLIVTTWKLCFK